MTSEGQYAGSQPAEATSGGPASDGFPPDSDGQRVSGRASAPPPVAGFPSSYAPPPHPTPNGGSPFVVPAVPTFGHGADSANGRPATPTGTSYGSARVPQPDDSGSLPQRGGGASPYGPVAAGDSASPYGPVSSTAAGSAAPAASSGPASPFRSAGDAPSAGSASPFGSAADGSLSDSPQSAWAPPPPGRSAQENNPFTPETQFGRAGEAPLPQRNPAPPIVPVGDFD